MRRFLLSLVAVIPIPFVPTTPTYSGHPATPAPVHGVAPTPRNPYMAANGGSEIHNDAWQTDAYTWAGPLGRSPQTLSSALVPNRDCGSLAFDQHGRVISVCVGISGPQLYMFDPNTLATLATFSLPPRQDLPSNLFQDFTGGGYFYLDNQDRVVTSTTTRHIYVIAETPGGFTLQHDYDLSQVLTSTEKITSALPDAHGLLWFVARRDGVVGTLKLSTGAVHVLRIGNGAQGEIENSFATDTGGGGGVYIATNRKLYRFRARAGGAPTISWQVTYPNSFQAKPGQVDDGTGTTPTVMAGGYVNITDNADPMDIVVYRTALRPTRVVRRHGHRRRVRTGRMVCRVPLFTRGASDTENSVIVAGRAMMIENNYGYTGPASITAGALTAPGFARVDINRDGRGCHLVWTNSTERAPTVVSKLSLATGLIYTYTKDPGPLDPWYWTALDFRTGKTVFKQLAGTGSLGFNNNYAGLALSRRGTAYLGTLGGLIAFRDGT
ncbi:MAG: hypothetical protein QOD66_3510 [Solirubrobacteraceae bacterium]|jgi:hypothetical protein|nr:hypothetical protein [Solirubrobacteraceae bacterium]